MAAIAKPTALITGCTPGGLGFEIAKAFEQRGFHVFATARDPTNVLVSSLSGTIEVLPLDVVSRKSIDLCRDSVQERTGGKLDVLVNNAGIMLLSPLIHVSIEEARNVFDTNVLGMLAVFQAFAPMLVRSQGTILNISSVAGAVPMAWQGVYNSSKAAGAFLSETIRIEMEPVGVRVITAMVGEMSTRFYSHESKSSGDSSFLPQGSWYRPVEAIIRKQARGELQLNNEDPCVTAHSLVSDVLSGRQGKIWRGGVAGFASMATWILPTRILEWVLHKDRGVYNSEIKNEVDVWASDSRDDFVAGYQ